MTLTIVYPAYNEEQNIALALDEAIQFLQNKKGEIIVVNDGSRDRTAEIVQSYQANYPNLIRLINHQKNQGYGATLRDGFLASNTELVFYTDSDLQFDISEMELLLSEIDQYDMVIGHRLNRQDPKIRLFLAWGFRVLIGLVFGTKFRDIDCAFKLFKREIFNQLEINSDRFLVDAEILVKASKLKYSIKQIGVHHKPRNAGQSTVRWFDIIRTLTELAYLWIELTFRKTSTNSVNQSSRT